MDINHTKKYIEVEDYSVSKEKFNLFLDEDLQLLKTVPQPASDKIADYYKSEDYISHTDGKRNLFEKIYQTVKKKAIQNKLSLLQNILPQKGKLLDIGCGTGDFLAEAQIKGWLCMGAEPNSKAKKLAQLKNIDVIEDTENLKEKTFDIITMWHVLEHVPDLEKQIKELYRLLKTNGTLILALPNYKSYDAQHYKKYWAAYDVPRHLWHFSQDSIEPLFLPFGFRLIEKYPMLFDSFYVSLLSEKYKTGKKNWVRAISIGLKSNIEARQTMEYSSLIYCLKKE
jgi:2-polyprenyl-3-methyl-5-hydroxy-6-metoxy-1,4-benzoquinol methylase